MRKVILQIGVSLDGFIQGSNGDLAWMFIDDELWQNIDELLGTVDVVLFGRAAYQDFEQYWPTAATNPKSPQNEVDFAHWIEKTPKIVFSTTLSSADWANSKLVKSDVADEIATLKQQLGKHILLFGGAGIAQTFMKLGLIDEYRIKIYPVVLGDGIPLFKNGPDRNKLKLLTTRTFSSGVVEIHYQADRTESADQPTINPKP